MSVYTDIFVLPVPIANMAAYRKLAEVYRDVALEHGALSYVELQADDVDFGKFTSFPRSVNMKEGETVLVALTTYTSRAHRDEVSARIYADPRVASMAPAVAPFDTRRMFWGGFTSFLAD